MGKPSLYSWYVESGKERTYFPATETTWVTSKYILAWLRRTCDISRKKRGYPSVFHFSNPISLGTKVRHMACHRSTSALNLKVQSTWWKLDLRCSSPGWNLGSGTSSRKRMEFFEHMVPSLLRLDRCRDPKVSFENLRWMCGRAITWCKAFSKCIWKRIRLFYHEFCFDMYNKRWRVVVSAEDLSSPATTVNSVKLDFAETVSTLKRSFWQKQFLVICRCTSSWSRITQLLVTLSNLFCWLASFSPRWATATRWFANPATTAEFWLLPNIQTFNTTCL